MHELSIAEAILDNITQIVDQQKIDKTVKQIKRVTRINIELGNYSGIIAESLKFCFPLVAENTIAAKARLNIKNIPLCLKCDKCLSTSFPKDFIMMCPKCDSTEVTILSGQEFTIKSIDIIE